MYSGKDVCKLAKQYNITFPYRKRFWPENITEEQMSFFKDTFIALNLHNADCLLPHTKLVSYPGEPKDKSNGFFIGGEDNNGIPFFAVGCGTKFDNWFPIFIHEFCHFEQWHTDSSAWVKGYFLGHDPLQLQTLWFDKKIELTKEQRKNIFNCSIKIELDCEKRAVHKIKQYNLPIDTKEYIQKANAYLYTYTMAMFSRRWRSMKTKSPYNNLDVWPNLPDTFQSDYSTIPPKIKSLYVKHVFKYNK